MKYLSVLLLLTILYEINGTAQHLEKVNFHYEYAVKPEVNFYALLQRKDDQLRLNASFRFNLNSDFDDFTISYEWTNVYVSNPAGMKAFEASKFVKKEDGAYQLRENFTYDSSKPICLIYALNNKSQRAYFFIVHAETDKRIPESELIALDASGQYFIDAPYVKNGSTILLKGMTNAPQLESPVYITYYNRSFNYASPPMSSKSQAEARMTIDSTFQTQTNASIQLNKEGLYLFQTDTLKPSVYTLRVVNNQYPKLAKMEELVNSLVYISTAAKYKEMINSNDKRVAFEGFWLNLFKSPDGAKKHIKNYYRRIKYANELFTDYKLGWKNDKGMIYIIFGPPDNVSRAIGKETWSYRKSDLIGKTKFTFREIKKPLSRNAVVLQRSKDFSSTWYRAVGLWRKGKIKGI